jgi:hypothetical protein
MEELSQQLNKKKKSTRLFTGKLDREEEVEMGEKICWRHITFTLALNVSGGSVCWQLTQNQIKIQFEFLRFLLKNIILTFKRKILID